MIFNHGKIAVVIEDIVFFIIYGIFIMCFTVTAARSEFRFYFVVGNTLGFILYFTTVGSIVSKLLKIIIESIKKFVIRLVKKIALICGKIINKFVINSQKTKSSKKTLD